MQKNFIKVKQEELLTVAKELKVLVEDFFSKNQRACIIFLEGDLGAGKTTFTKELGKVLGEQEDIISPTFVLRKDYNNLIHIDGYRFEKEEEGKSLELDREIDKHQKVIVIEWPERFVKAINLKPDFSITFKPLNESERDISIIAH